MAQGQGQAGNVMSGTVVTYTFTDVGDPLANVRVLMDGSAVPASGQFTMTRAHRFDTAVDRHVVERIASTSDRLSSWILAERRPLSLPDPRWDTLTYGVHACETFLKSIVGS